MYFWAGYLDLQAIWHTRPNKSGDISIEIFPACHSGDLDASLVSCEGGNGQLANAVQR
jgi:hypothetical protein